MRRTLMICMIAALAAFPLMAGAQQSGTMSPTYEEEQTKGRLMPKDAHPHQSSSKAMPSEVRPQENVVRDAQIALRNAGYEPGRIDGIIGPMRPHNSNSSQPGRLSQAGDADRHTSPETP